MRSVKAVHFGYVPTEDTRRLLETFRMMVNHAIAIALKEGVRGRLNLRNRIYLEFQDRYNVVSRYPYSVAEVAWSILKKHRAWDRRPEARHLMMKIDSFSFKLHYGLLDLPFAKNRRLLIPPRYGDYQRSFLNDPTVKRGSVTVTERKIIIAYSKLPENITPIRRVGIDLNQRSAVLSDGRTFDLSEVARLHTEYGIRRRNFCIRHPYDERLKARFSVKSREKQRVRQFLNRVSKAIVQDAKKANGAIVLERLAGIRYSHQRGNGEGTHRRRRMALWPFRELQRQVEYKAGWDGVQVEYVNPAWTTKTCNKCKCVNHSLGLAEREWRCPSCGAILDRDLNAAVNIERRGKIVCLAVVRPGAQGGVKL